MPTCRVRVRPAPEGDGWIVKRVEIGAFGWRLEGETKARSKEEVETLVKRATTIPTPAMGWYDDIDVRYPGGWH